MTFEQIQRSVAIAIYEVLDVVEACPTLRDLPISKMESSVKAYIESVQEQLTTLLATEGCLMLQRGDIEGLSSLMLRKNVRIPANQMQKICKSVVDTCAVESRCILDCPDYQNPITDSNSNTVVAYHGRKLWYSKINITI